MCISHTDSGNTSGSREPSPETQETLTSNSHGNQDNEWKHRSHHEDGHEAARLHSTMPAQEERGKNEAKPADERSDDIPKKDEFAYQESNENKEALHSQFPTKIGSSDMKDTDYELDESEYVPEVLSRETETESLDDYNPEDSLPKKPLPTGLPAKPSISSRGGDQSFNRTIHELYNELISNEIAKDPSFSSLSREDQARRFSEKLKNVDPDLIANFNQVFSYNMPFRDIRNPIPLIPVNEYSRRPDLTVPASEKDSEDYRQFLQSEIEFLRAPYDLPEGLRLFVGNLASNTISKEDLFRIFKQYGDVVEISIKAGYGFVQFSSIDACQECIKGESNVPLHGKVLRLDASRKKSKASSEDSYDPQVAPSRGRERPSGTLQNDPKRQKLNDCKVLVVGKSSNLHLTQLKAAFTEGHITYDVEDSDDPDLDDLISDAAYEGYFAVCLLKGQDIDVHIFEETSNGIKFDEYAKIDVKVAVNIIKENKKKSSIAFDEAIDPENEGRHGFVGNYSMSNSFKAKKDWSYASNETNRYAGNNITNRSASISPAVQQQNTLALNTHLMQILQSLDPASMKVVVDFLQQKLANYHQVQQQMHQQVLNPFTPHMLFPVALFPQAQLLQPQVPQTQLPQSQFPQQHFTSNQYSQVLPPYHNQQTQAPDNTIVLNPVSTQFQDHTALSQPIPFQVQGNPPNQFQGQYQQAHTAQEQFTPYPGNYQIQEHTTMAHTHNTLRKSRQQTHFLPNYGLPSTSIGENSQNSSFQQANNLLSQLQNSQDSIQPPTPSAPPVVKKRESTLALMETLARLSKK